jgi:hypothetical protein
MDKLTVRLVCVRNVCELSGTEWYSQETRW